MNSGIGGNLELSAFCLSARSDKFLRDNSKRDLQVPSCGVGEFLRGGGSANMGNTGDDINR